MLICHCKQKTDRDIREAMHRGAKSCAEVTHRCEAGRGCGGCKKAIISLLRSRSDNRTPSGDTRDSRCL